MAHDVFISHSAKDKTTADAVCAMLELNGVRCWIAPRDVTPGMEWSECIIDAIEECRIMVLVFTTNANESSQIRREVERAVNHGVAILPFRIEDVLPGKGLEYFIGNVHWLDAITTPLEIHLKSLAETVKMLLARMPAHDETGSGTPAPPATATSSVLESDASAQLSGGRNIFADQTANLSAPPVASSSVSSRGEEIPLARRLWFRAALGGAALLILLFVTLYFTRKPAAPQTFRTDWSGANLASVQSAASAGNAGAQYILGYRYNFGSGGVSKDYKQAFEWMQKSAAQGFPAGENGLGNLYLSGDAVPEDDVLAAAWFRKAAEHGYPEAQTAFGYMYEKGLGVQKDYAQAIFWFRKAADQDDGIAMRNLGLVYLYGDGVPMDAAQARTWFQKAAAHGDDEAKRQLEALDAHH